MTKRHRGIYGTRGAVWTNLTQDYGNNGKGRACHAMPVNTTAWWL